MERYQRFSAICFKPIHKIDLPPYIYIQYTYVYKYGQETNQNTDIKYNQTEMENLFKNNNTVNPHPYTHEMTPPMTPSVTALS